VKQDDRSAASHVLLGGALAMQGKLAEAQAEYERALDLDPEQRGPGEALSPADPSTLRP